MKVNLDVPIVVLGTDGVILELKKGSGAPMLKDVIATSLRLSHPELDDKDGYKEKHAKYLLDKRITPEAYIKDADKVSEIDLTPEELEMIKVRIGTFYMNPIFVGKCVELLEVAK